MEGGAPVSFWYWTLLAHVQKERDSCRWERTLFFATNKSRKSYLVQSQRRSAIRLKGEPVRALICMSRRFSVTSSLYARVIGCLNSSQAMWRFMEYQVIEGLSSKKRTWGLSADWFWLFGRIGAISGSLEIQAGGEKRSIRKRKPTQKQKEMYLWYVRSLEIV